MDGESNMGWKYVICPICTLDDLKSSAEVPNCNAGSLGIEINERP